MVFMLVTVLYLFPENSLLKAMGPGHASMQVHIPIVFCEWHLIANSAI